MKTLEHIEAILGGVEPEYVEMPPEEIVDYLPSLGPTNQC